MCVISTKQIAAAVREHHHYNSSCECAVDYRYDSQWYYKCSALICHCTTGYCVTASYN